MLQPTLFDRPFSLGLFLAAAFGVKALCQARGSHERTSKTWRFAGVERPQPKEFKLAYWDLLGISNRELVECRKIMPANKMRMGRGPYDQRKTTPDRQSRIIVARNPRATKLRSL